MKESSSSKDLQRLLDAIKASDVVENRVQLLAEVGELEITEKSEVASLIGALTVFWEDFTCLDISQCTLNKAILHVAAKYLELDVSACLGEFLSLGIKASVWCGKHLKMTLMSTEESPEEEHSNLFYQLLVNLLSYSASSFSALARYSISSSKEFILTIQNFISEQLNLTKDALSEIKRINVYGSEVQKIAQVVLDAVIRFCKVYCHGVNWDFDYLRTQEDKKVIGSEEASDADNVINITKYTIDKLCEVGILAANDGGSLVSVLNLSWKGVVTLLQLGKGTLAAKVDVAGVILTLISLAQQSLRCAVETWSLQQGSVTTTEAKRIFLPVKFYLINAVRIISQYTTQAFFVYKEIVWCVVMISSFKVYLSKVEHLKAATEALAEILEPTSFHLLNSILNSVQINQEEKFQVLNWLFSDKCSLKSVPGVSGGDKIPNSVDAVLFLGSDAMGGVQTFSLGQVNLFLDLLRSSSDLEDDVKLWMARKLQWLLDILVDKDVYSASLSLEVPMSCQNKEFSYQPLFHSILNALKTFMVVMSSHPAWGDVESFLLANLFHPHIHCCEIVTELWCFMIRYAETDAVNDIIDKLCSLLMCTASPEAVISPGSALRKIARSICVIITYCSKAVGDRVYNSVTGDNGSRYSPNMYIALLMEGFPLNLLSERTRSIAQQRLLTEYFDFLESFGSESSKASAFEIYGAPVYALSATLQSLQVSTSDTEMKTLKFLVALIDKYRKSDDRKLKDIYCRLLSEVLGIISNMKHSYSCDEMERVILELQNLFISRPASASDSLLFLCKPNLANFMAGIGHVELAESDNNAMTSAIWKLYHVLLREQHWAFIHLALTAFGYFAARTSCNQLWRFVPQDAALSFDLESGNEADEDRFMSELKAFLEKECASLLTKPTSDHIEMLVKEGRKLKEILQRNADINEDAIIFNAMDIDEDNQGSKKRKIPDGISKGVELLQNGLKVMGDGLSQWQHNQAGLTDIHDRFLAHISRLEDVVSHLVSLTGDS